MDSQVEKILAIMADEFIKNSAEFACKLAKHRGSDTLDKHDVKFAIERLYNMSIPQKQPEGTANRTLTGIQSQIPPYPQASTSNYKQNIALAKKANEQNSSN